MKLLKKTGTYRLIMLITIAVVLLNTWVAVKAIGTLFAAQTWLFHTLQAITQTEDLALEVRTADSAARGYLLTGKSSFEDRFNKRTANVQNDLDALQKLTLDNPSQQRRIAYTRTRVAAKLGVLESAIAMRHGHPHGGLDPDVLDPALSDAPDGQASVSYCITQIENEERRLLEQRQRGTMIARRNVVLSGAGASMLDIILLILAFELLIRAHQNRERLEQSAERIESLNTELQALNSDLEKRVELRTKELEASNKELEAFSYSVSHDLRAPLRTIDGFSLALKEDFSHCLNDEGQDYIGRVRAGVQRMGTLIDALLQLSRVSRSELQREKINLSMLSKLVFDELRAGDASNKATFTAHPDVFAEADSRLIRIALENLIGNAMKYSSRTEAPEILFGSDARDGQTVYFIRDNGAGFDMQYVDRLFTAFQRLHGDRDFKGSGIGLATVSRIIRRHHGNIWAESELGKGATFYFTLEA